MDLINELSAAAERGVEVTILTNHREPIELRYKWKFWETRDSGWGKFVAAGYTLVVQDCDGDFSWFELRRGREVIAKGDENGWEPYYHFDSCLLRAEAALRSEVTRRKAEFTSHH